MPDRKSVFPMPRIVAIAALAGVVAGGLALYVTGGLDGNIGRDRAPALPAGEIAETDVSACEAKAQTAKTLAGAATGDVAAMLAADPPQSLKSLSFNGSDGAPMTLDGLAGKTVLVNLWATWCAPCRAEMPALDELERELGGEDFEVVAINVDTGSDEKPKAFLGETGVNALGFYRDATMGVFNDLKKRGLALGLPVTLLVDADGCLLASMNGPAEWAGEDAKAWVGMATGRAARN